MSRPTDDAAEQQVRAFVEQTLGARVTRCERQPRWRPAWFLVAERQNRGGAAERLPLYFRGDRGMQDGGRYDIEHEWRCLRVLADAGILVPRLYGFCESPRGILMARAPGRADLSTAVNELERERVQDDYIRILADIHALDIGPFEAVGLERPQGGAAMSLADFPTWERGYRKAKALPESRPEPLLEFGIGWLHRNVPESTAKVTFVCSDSGQFMFDNGRVTAVLDLELAHLGDPAEDLAGLRTRDLSEPLGDLRRATATYARITGSPVDVRLVDYHTVRFSLVTPLAIAALVANPAKGVDLVQYLCWYWVYSRAAIEVIAHMQGTALATPALPRACPTRFSPAHSALAATLQSRRDTDEFSAYQTDATGRIAEYLRRVDLYGAALEAADLDEATALLGERPADWLEADRALEALVAEAGPEHDAELVRFFHRRAVRQEFLLAPVMRELEGASIQMLD